MKKKKKKKKTKKKTKKKKKERKEKEKEKKEMKKRRGIGKKWWRGNSQRMIFSVAIFLEFENEINQTSIKRFFLKPWYPIQIRDLCFSWKGNYFSVKEFGIYLIFFFFFFLKDCFYFSDGGREEILRRFWEQQPKWMFHFFILFFFFLWIPSFWPCLRSIITR